MCELFAFCGEQPALLQLSLQQFAAHGGGGHNADGWGVAHQVDRDMRLLKDVGAASDSACLAFIESHALRSGLLLSHIRHATQGERAVQNCQPFLRELGGAMHAFAHNGDLDRRRLAERTPPRGFRPVGDTDSEQAFCLLLERLRPLWQEAAGPPPLAQRAEVVAAVAAELRALGPANFIYADGDALFAHGHRRMHAGEGIRPPGLHVRCRACDGSTATLEAPGLRILPGVAPGAQVLVASVPLTADGDWRALAEGELLVVRRGRPAA